MVNKFQRQPIALLVIISLFILSSCDPGSKFKYVISNKTSRPLKIKYQFPGGPPVMSVIIAVDSSKIIREENRLGYVDDINQRMDSIYFYSFVLKRGGQISYKNFKDKRYWILKEINHQSATYTLSVTDSLFNK